jgi:hypothetical protein
MIDCAHSQKKGHFAFINFTARLAYKIHFALILESKIHFVLAYFGVQNSFCVPSSMFLSAYQCSLKKITQD